MSSQAINICGVGPGNPNFILPEVFKLVQLCDLLVGAQRHLEIFDVKDKDCLVLRNNISQIVETLKSKRSLKITVLVSGDTGFHSFLAVMLKYFSVDDLHVVPGISTYQYFFAKLGMLYHDAWIGSLHGVQTDFITQVKLHQKSFLLTDKENSWKAICNILFDNDLGDCIVHIGNRLSYNNETIITQKAIDLINEKFDFDLCAVIIFNPNFNS